MLVLAPGAGAGADRLLVLVLGAGRRCWRWRCKLSVDVVETGCWCRAPGAGAVSWLRTRRRQFAGAGAGAGRRWCWCGRGNRSGRKSASSIQIMLDGNLNILARSQKSISLSSGEAEFVSIVLIVLQIVASSMLLLLGPANDTYGLCCLRAYFCAHKLISTLREGDGERKTIRCYSPNRDSDGVLAANKNELAALLKGCRCWCWCCGPECWCCELAERAWKTGRCRKLAAQAADILVPASRMSTGRGILPSYLGLCWCNLGDRGGKENGRYLRDCSQKSRTVAKLFLQETMVLFRGVRPFPPTPGPPTLHWL